MTDYFLGELPLSWALHDGRAIDALGAQTNEQRSTSAAGRP